TYSAWATINTALASDDVTVYFSARNASSNTNQASTTPLNVARTDNSTHVLTLDGISQYNANDAAPSWATNVVPSASNYQSASKFQITASVPLSTNGVVAACQPGVAIIGFRLISTGGQIAMLHYVNNLVVQYSELSANAGATIGPGLIAG